ncbi:hypothetical protein CGCSCA1_v014464 [Colletotrichum siamense]|nr:hypothetical protein CGCSCA1_v014464 [Colletotrichum siamense]
MSGPYNYGFRPPHGQSPLSPETPTSAYKTNLGRKKTKKWVEAKAQNYDGDDWGNDFDDEEPEEPIPVPPLKPASRQPSPSQATTANLPSNLPSHQPPAPQSAGLPTMRPPQPALNESGLSTSPRATAGLPPLQIQTPSSPAPAPAPARSEPQNVQPPIVSGPSSMDSVSDKGPYEQFVSPQSAHTGPTPEPSLVRNEQPQSVIPQNGGRRTSPAPAQPQSTRFPPRKSSMGQHDSDRLPSSRSSSTHPPQVEQRSGSPSGIISPGTSSTSKPSFVRPSDIYRRVDNEKDRERGSMDSGRPSLDSSGGFKTDRSLSPAKPSPADTRSDEQVSGSSLGKPEGEDAIQGNLRPTLAPVAERKSEYGFDNVLMRPQTHAQNQTMPPSSESPNLGIPAPAPEPQIERPSEEEVAQQRRYSSSPRLPDLARMSLFGDDFFSNPGKFADDAPPMPALTPQLQAAAAASAPQHVGNPPAAPVALSTGSSTPQRADSPRVSEQIRKDLTPPAEVTRNQENVDSAKSDLASLPSRPSLPGGWVTETRSVTEEQTPPAVAEKKTLGVDPGEVSPISDNEHDEVPGSGVTIVKGVASMPIPISNASGQPMPASSQASEESHSADAPVHPLAPLNAGHSDSSSSRFVAPERLQRESTMSTVTSPSPVKESDKLREEIMRSLSPVRPTSDFDSFNGNRAGQSEEDTGPRESTYLHGVYDDYWTAGDDKPDVPELPAKQPELDVHSVAKQNVSDVPPLSPRKENAGTPPTLGRRFSWEAESEQVTPDPGDSQEKPVSDSQPQAAPVAPVSSSSPALGHEQSPALSSEETRDAEQTQPSTSTMDETHIAVPTTSGTMSHQVSQASSVPRDRLDSENIEPPSPVSAVTDKNHASAAPPRRLSLAEEKSMVRVSSNPVSPSPPPGEHPALARSSEATSPPPPAPAEPSQDQPAAPLKIINFKEIMEIQNASERINKYNETRAQFASMDSGLNNWLVNLKSQHPEHANATASFAANASNVGQPSASPTASQPNSQQPYYQQYLNASSTNTIPEHPASQTPPPQLPQTSRISPFDALTQEKQASAWAPPRPQTPKHPAGVRRDTESEPVSPVSDTQSMSAPNHHDNADDADAFVNGTGDLQVPRPIGKTQPSWDPFTGTPLVEEEGFEMGQSRDPSPHVQHAPHAAPAAQFHYASTTKNARSDDDWVVVSPQSAPSEQVYVLSPDSPQLVRSFQPTESSREIFDNEDESDVAAGDTASSDAQQVSQQDQDHTHRNTQHQVLQQEQDQKTQQQNQLQTRQQLPSQQQSVSPQRQSSFVGLPPIRRSSTFGINLTKRAKKRFSLEEDDDVDGQVIVSSPISTVTTSQDPIDANTPSLHQHVGRDASTRFAQPARIETGLSASRKDSAMSHQVISATSTQAATLATESTGVAWGDDEKRALDPRHSFRPGGSTPHPIDTKLAMQQAGRTGGGQLGMRSQQGVVPGN